ncbi:MAG: DUF4838 domain-containing protein [Pirellulales bacterium]|jgi:hypothetical protein|nr:DUF4838 domain-containing protein [Thermoguttaceae bacterium]MDD4785856.1 DUF4838 domain-containing protein [Pirellulales bacterium]NLZ02028.1 DUF4838 domain-containing protein [Pirellulaceae bacterium]
MPNPFLLAVLSSCLLSAAAVAAEPAGVDLANLEGWDIVVDDEAIPSERHAAEELRDHLALATGRTLPIVNSAGRADRHFFVGPGEEAGKRGLAAEKLGPEDLRIVVGGGKIAIVGGRPRGTLYGVYTFLEDYLGVRFLTADHTYVPKLAAERVIGPVDRTYRPPLEMRWAYYGEVNRNPAFAARLRVNTVGNEPELGGRSGQRLISHSFAHQIPSSKYGQEHPEYYCLRDGKRIAPAKNDSFENEPCLTNPDVLRIVTEAVLKEIEAHPEAANVSVSQNDNAKNCLCPACAAVDEREGTPMGSLLEFVNAVADAVAAKHPNVKVGTLSYWYTRKPPKTLKPRPNVQIQLCSIECCMLHPINDPGCPKNVAFCQDMADWGKICDQIYIWNYNTNFHAYLLPCPNLRVIEPNIRYFVANNAKGVFMQAAGNANGAELSELRAYMISRLLWDPSLSGEKVMHEFLDLHYGPAAPPIRRFIARTHDRAAASGRHHNCFGRLADYGLDESDARAGLDAFAEAMRLADSEQTRRHVARASLCAYRAALEPIWHRDSGPLEPAVAEKLRPLARRFFELCDEFQVDRAQEWGEEIPQTRNRLKRVFGLGENEVF